jgi:hypothetical protein
LIHFGALPALCAGSLAVVISLSIGGSGGISPVGPQADGNEGYRQLWLGNSGDSGGAIDRFRSALAADPAFPYRWSDLGDALLSDPSPNSLSRARYCFDRALALAPGDPQIALRAANFHFRVGETVTALRLDSEVLRLVPDYDQTVFLAYFRMGGDPRRVLDTGIGSNPRAGGEYLRFLSGRADFRGADFVWAWLEQHHYATAPLAGFRAASLLSQSRPAEAFALRARYLTPRGSSVSGSELVENAGFETAPSGVGFDWRVDPCSGVAVTVDSRLSHSGSSSLRVVFDGQGNVDFHHVGQPVWLETGRYRLSAWVRSDDLTTDQGLALHLKAPGLDVFTPAATGSQGWTPVTVEFTVSGSAVPGRLEIVRCPSARFDNRIRGTAWIDDVSLVRLGP